MATCATVLTLFCIIISISGTIAGRGNTTAASPTPAPAPAPSNGGESFVVQGKVYCDPCRIQFPTKISYPVPNTKVILSCRERENDAETFTVEGTCDSNGMYSITASGDHEEEICDVRVTESPDKKCPEVMDDESSSRVSLTDKNGVRGKTRMANPIGFMVKEVDPRCKDILAEIGIMGY
ncbi:anther-specific protein LAT52-like [Cynara cardunculus var. scolymus]|uniref:anther-specific protein LAT52-like n=1 Tax=Cynara cardunculus var. scolymus TaxID=59895 RepID=UPI000D62C6F0|nr:anther-specific protein LAT52-like [Cynara cardunculus var. scolymus]